MKLKEFENHGNHLTKFYKDVTMKVSILNKGCRVIVKRDSDILYENVVLKKDVEKEVGMLYDIL